jgi:hypothetical protein
MCYLPFFVSLCAVSILLPACGKKDPQTSVAPAPEAVATSGVTPGNDPGAASQPAAAPAPTADTSKAFADVNEAMKAKDYQRAAATLIAVQQMPLNEQQANALRGQMVQLQATLAGAVASGDPQAKAAAEKLRASSMH